MTCRQLSLITGVDKKAISSAMEKYRRSPQRCFRRLRKREKSSRYYFYRINNYGIVRYYEYLRRVKLGYDLNLRRKIPEKKAHWDGLKTIDLELAIKEGLRDEEVIHYLTLTKQGVLEMGLLEDSEEVLRAAGLFRDYLPSDIKQ